MINAGIAAIESQLLFFIWAVVGYAHLDVSQVENTSSNFWSALLQLLSLFNETKHPTTCIWVLDVILAASRKHALKEVLNEKTIRHDMNDIIKIHLYNLAAFSIQKISFSSVTAQNFKHQ